MRILSLIVLSLLIVLTVGCSTVKPYQKEHLADPIMTVSQDEAMRELKWLDAREGSTGGAGGAGGGCACR
jgi:cysteine synthase